MISQFLIILYVVGVIVYRGFAAHEIYNRAPLLSTAQILGWNLLALISALLWPIVGPFELLAYRRYKKLEKSWK